MKHVDERYKIRCTGCLSEQTFTIRDRAAAHLVEHDGHYDLVVVERSGWRQLQLLLGRELVDS